jgi:hypothetical protein
VFFEKLEEDPILILKEICEWLNIDYDFFYSHIFHVENKTVDFRNKNFHKIAIILNMKNERFFRRYPKIKKMIRNMYSIVNGKEYKETISDGTRQYLEELFKPYNKQLAFELSQRGYKDLPQWLARISRKGPPPYTPRNNGTPMLPRSPSHDSPAGLSLPSYTAF